MRSYNRKFNIPSQASNQLKTGIYMVVRYIRPLKGMFNYVVPHTVLLIALGQYNADMKEDSAVGWIAGLAYQIPEIALKHL